MCQRFTGLNQIFTCPGQLDRGFVAAYVFYAEISILKEKGKDMVIYTLLHVQYLKLNFFVKY